MRAGDPAKSGRESYKSYPCNIQQKLTKVILFVYSKLKLTSIDIISIMIKEAAERTNTHQLKNPITFLSTYAILKNSTVMQRRDILDTVNPLYNNSVCPQII